ncbi:hypothetical protein Poli38472_014622 [Pythium oligandrum]|uniref:Uncharacterized protein n=1 Tax=Pythium oligandrum TaxID=41045 RepID=A0A8K1FLK4_PYTOL|nr:hypothetical protein Poli38472_014622 [Pythium oligandrum]|eukprot:TMW63917.1 hypothetical protein Poli38472_014622 [Pythium oligandrum]
MQRRRRDDPEADDDVAYDVAANEGFQDAIVVMAHIKDKIIPVHCGFGTQQVIWIGHVAIARYDEENNEGWRTLGVPMKIVKDGKEELKMTDILCDVVQNHSHVYITTSMG